jgi:hypothetical protein
MAGQCDNALGALHRYMLEDIEEKRRASDRMDGCDRADTNISTSALHNRVPAQALLNSFTDPSKAPSSSGSKRKPRRKKRSAQSKSAGSGKFRSITDPDPVEMLTTMSERLQDEHIGFDLYYDCLALYRLCKSIVNVLGSIYR